MSRIEAVFTPAGKKALIVYVTAGYPDVATTLKIVPLLEQCGADIIELGIPFSDPMADGATIQRAGFQALRNGVTPRTCLDIAGSLRQRVELPLLFMTYLNPVLAYGAADFCRQSQKSGIDGLIVPDLNPDEGKEMETLTRKTGLDLVYLLAPNATDTRVKLVTKRARGFVYLVSVAGVTGARARLPANLESFARKVKSLTDLPVCIGFGISTPEQAKQAAAMADGVIIGSRLLQLIEEDTTLAAAAAFIRKVRKAIDTV